MSPPLRARRRDGEKDEDGEEAKIDKRGGKKSSWGEVGGNLSLGSHRPQCLPSPGAKIGDQAEKAGSEKSTHHFVIFILFSKSPAQGPQVK